jgi:hypothetical protein
MSAPLRLTSTDLRNLAAALDKLTVMHRAHGVLPGHYDRGVTIRTEEGDDVQLGVSVVDDELVIDDRYGS